MSNHRFEGDAGVPPTAGRVFAQDLIAARQSGEVAMTARLTALEDAVNQLKEWTRQLLVLGTFLITTLALLCALVGSRL
jgi:hypothetical protein